MIGLKEFVSLSRVAMPKEKDNYFSYHSNSCKEDKTFYQKHECELVLIKKIELTR